MDEQIWDRQPGEGNWYPRFLIYRDMPHNTPPVPRTLFGAANLYQQSHKAKKLTGTPPHWIEASRKWHWQERAEAYDAHLQQEREAQYAAERAKVLTTGFAMMHKRIEALNDLAVKLLTQVEQDDRLWLPDMKSVGTGPHVERVDLVTFNEGLVREIRACFADIAEEMGERVKKSEVAVSDFPKVYLDVGLDDDGVDP